MPVDAEELIKKYGEEYRTLIIPALEFLEREEPKWELDRPISRNGYIKDLVRAAKKGNRKQH